jgi:putative acetyltransferase
MATIKTYKPSMQTEIEACFNGCVLALGWEYQPDGRHSDIVSIEDTYMRHGCFWCLFDDKALIGMAAVRCIDYDNKIAELKRLYILPEYQGRGYGCLLFKHALDYTKEQRYKTARVDTRHDRTASLHLIDKYRFRRTEQYNDNQFAELFFELNLNKYESEESPCR